MRKLSMIFCLLYSTSHLLGQHSSSSKTDSTKQARSFMIRDPALILNDDPLIIINNKPYSKSMARHFLKNVNLPDILDESVLKGDSAIAAYGSKGRKGLVIFITKQYAISQYQKKFSRFSEAYKKYVTVHDEGCLFYIVNDDLSLIKAKDNDRIRKLYKIPADKIESVSLVIQETCCGVNRWCHISVKQ